MAYFLLNISHIGDTRLKDEKAVNNKLQNKDVSDRIMFHKQHCHVILELSKIFWTNEGTFKAPVTVLHLMKAYFIHRCQIIAEETANDKKNLPHQSIFSCWFWNCSGTTFAIKALLVVVFRPSELDKFNFQGKGWQN